jgi:hypothetical protein
MLSNQKQVMVGLDRLSGKAMRGARPEYMDGVIDPLVAAVGGAVDERHALQRLGDRLFHSMDTTGLVEALSNAGVNAGCIGRVTATPRKKAK